MNIINIIILSFITCIDSFLLCLLNKNSKKTNYFLVPAIFSLCQTLCFTMGYYLGDFIEIYLQHYIKYLVFIIFSSLSIKLIVDTLINKGKEKYSTFTIKQVFMQALFSSSDSLFLGLPLSFNDINLITTITILSSITFLACLLALLLRNKLKGNYEEKITIIGASILFIFAFKSLI